MARRTYQSALILLCSFWSLPVFAQFLKEKEKGSVGGLTPPSKLLPPSPSEPVESDKNQTVLNKRSALDQAPISHFSTKHAPITTKPHSDLRIPAARVEISWLSDPITYGYRLWAKSQGETVELHGFLPNEALKNKALQMAKVALGNVAYEDHMVVYPQMVLAPEYESSGKTLATVRERLKSLSLLNADDLSLLQDEQGILMVSGRLDHFDDRLKIIEALKMLPGCKAVKYDVKIGPPKIIITQAESTQSSTAAKLLPSNEKASSGPALSRPMTSQKPAASFMNTLPPMPPASLGTSNQVPKLPIPQALPSNPPKDNSQVTPASTVLPSAFFDPEIEQIEIAPRSIANDVKNALGNPK